jgi:2-(1,2-epoxy-1,2-dihydrophenyl)acetyl-CoA isomerase
VEAERALELGLVNEVLSDDEFEAGVERRAKSFAVGPTTAYGLMKDLIWKAAGGYLEKHLDAEATAQSEAGSSSDHLEGVQAFLEKRPARFEGN